MNDDLFSWAFIENAFRSIRKGKRHFKTYILLDSPSGLYKIGRAVDVKKRVKDLSVANANLSIVMIIERNVENELHKAYSDKRVKSEWFRLTEKDIKDINFKYNNSSL